MAKVDLSNIVGVFTNGDPDDLDKVYVESLKNFRQLNGKIVKTHGSGVTNVLPHLVETVPDFTITNLFTFNNPKLTGDGNRTCVVKVNNKNRSMIIEFNDGV